MLSRFSRNSAAVDGPMPKPRRFHEYRVEFSGVAEVPFTAFKNQVADNAEEAARLFKKELKAAPLDALDPRISTGRLKIKKLRLEVIVPPKQD